MSQAIDSALLRLYEPIRKLGSGAYGHVFKVQDRATKQIFALKKIFDAFQHSTDAQRTYREVMFLEQIANPNIIRMHKVFKAKNSKDVYLLFEFMEADLFRALHERILEEVHHRFIAYQILKALLYLHSGRVVHRDIKPSNILLNADCIAKLCDFGLVRSTGASEHEAIMTEHLATRWYRAPQILLGSQSYGPEVDIWSLGCIIAQFYHNGRPLFPGNSTLEQLELTTRLTGLPSPQDLDDMKCLAAEPMVRTLNASVRKPLQDYLVGAPQDALDMVEAMLHFNPLRRATARKLLQMPYVRRFRSEREQHLCRQLIRIPVHDSVRLSLKDYRDLVYQFAEKSRLTERDPFRVSQERNTRCEFTVRKHFRVNEDRRQNSLGLAKKKRLENERHSLKELIRDEKPMFSLKQSSLKPNLKGRLPRTSLKKLT